MRASAKRLPNSDGSVFVADRQVGGQFCHHDIDPCESAGNLTWLKCGEPQHWVPGSNDPTDKVKWVESAEPTAASVIWSQPYPTPSAPPYQGDPWSQLPPTQPQQPQGASYGGWQAPRWANGVGSYLRPLDVRNWTVADELKSFNGDITNYDNWRRRV